MASIQKGQRVIVSGRLRVRDWSTDDKHGTNVEIDADAVGHDLSWGTTSFTRSTATAVADAEQAADGEVAVDDPDADEDAGDEADDPEPRQEPAAAGLPF